MPSPVANPSATPFTAAPAFPAVVGPEGVVFAEARGSVFGSEADNGDSDFRLRVGLAGDDCVRVFGGGEGSLESSKCKRLVINCSEFATFGFKL